MRAKFAVALMAGLPLDTWIRLIVWMAIGLLIYFIYGMRHTKISQRREDQAAD